MAVEIRNDRLFGLHTKNTSYIMAVSPEGILENLYWGKRLEDLRDFDDVTSSNRTINMKGPQLYREECSSFGGMRFKETSFKAAFDDGVRDFRYSVKEYRVEECGPEADALQAAGGGTSRLEIVLADDFYPLTIHLYYEVYEEDDIIRKWRTVENSGSAPITLERIYSGEYGLAGTDYETINYNGRWGAEFLSYSEPVKAGKKVYESLYGLTAHTVGPFFLVHKNATETEGDVYYGVLEYSGNFKTVVEAVNSGYVNILIGMSDTDFSWTLHPGESFETPAVYSGYAGNGFGEMSHTLHRFSKNHIMPEYLSEKPLPVLYNSWYSTTFRVECSEQIELAKKAAAMGIELFVIDDGWFEGRVDDTAGLGDWYVDRNKFPGGMNELIDAVHDLGMKFGVWIEPEMVNPNSRLYEEHPEWIYRYPNREVLMGRNQYELDMSNPEVVDYLIQIFDELLSEHQIEYIKWDMNRYAAEMGSPTREAGQWKELWFRNTMGVYRLIDELRKRHPHVEFEACSSGGGRVDYGAMRYFDEYWPSDNTDPLDRLFMQEWYSYLYPIKYMRAWLTDDFGMDGRKIPLSFSMHVAMCGALGIGIDLNKAPKEKMAEIGGYISKYKEIRDIVQFGELYRLCTLRESEIQVVQYNKDSASVVFAFLDHERYGNSLYTVKLRGLKADSRYSCEINGRSCVKTGAYLMQAGLEMVLKGDYDSMMVVLKEE